MTLAARAHDRFASTATGDSTATDRAAASGRPRVVLTIGKLDGVHAGHRHLAAHTQAVADRLGVASAAVVLHPDPIAVLTGVPVPRLTTIEERCARLRAFGVSIVEPYRFIPETAALGPAEFLDHLAERFAVAGMVVGPDFAFGRDRAGNVAALDGLARARGFGLTVVEPLEVAGEWVSSRRLRAVIEAGDIELARTLLRRPPRLVGTVVHGAARGRLLGYPTANLDPVADFVVPANGIYAVRTSWSDDRGAVCDVPGVASIGVRPTFDNGARLVEVHLFDYSGDLYGQEMTVDFLVRMRPEARFDTVRALVRQMDADAALARAILDREAAPNVMRSSEPGTQRVAARDLADLCTCVADVLLGRPAMLGEPDCRPGAGRGAVRGAVRGAGRGAEPGAGRGAEPGAGNPGTSRRVVSLAAPDDDSLMALWTAEIAAHPEIGWVEVYHAGAGLLHALVRAAAHVTPAESGAHQGASAPSAPTVPPVRQSAEGSRLQRPVAAAAPSVGPIQVRNDGWLEVELRRPPGERQPPFDQA